MGACLQLARLFEPMTPKRPNNDDHETGKLSWWQKKSRFFRRTIVLLVIITLGMAGWRLLRLGKDLQCERFMRIAATYKQNGNNEDAKLALLTAIRFWPDSSELLRRLAQLCDASDLKLQASQLYGSIWRKRELNIEDTRHMLVLSIFLNNELRTRYLLEHINIQSGGGLLPFLLKARARIALGDIPKAIADLQDAADKDYKVGLQVRIPEQAQALPPPFATSKDGFKTLAELADEVRDRSALPLYIGLLKACVPWDAQPEWAARLKKHPACDMRMRLLADAILVWRSPSTKPIVVAEILEFAKDKPLGERILASQWLLRENEPEQAASLIKDEEALEKAEAFTVWFEANAASGQSKKLLVAVSQLRETLPYGTWLLRSAQALDMVGKTEASREARLAALEQAKKNPDLCAKLLTESAFAGDRNFLPLFLQAMPNSASSKEKLRDLISSVRKKGDSRLFGTLLSAIDSTPIPFKDAHLRGELEYTNLLLAREIDWNALTKAGQQKPVTPESHFPYLAGLVAMGNPKEALSDLLKFHPNLDARTLEPWQQAILVWILAKNERWPEAFEFAALIPPHGLSTQERALLDRFLTPSPTRAKP